MQQVRSELGAPVKRRLQKAAVLLVLGLFGFLSILLSSGAPRAMAATSSNLNFQARLLNSAGGIVPDGTYNIDFKIYNVNSTTGTVGTCSGACLWEETRKNFSSQGVQVINGYFSVNLGSVTSFPSINWDQQLWLTMNIGGTSAGASPTWDGEMQNAGNSIALTALPYAFVAGQLAQTSGANRGTLSFSTVATNPAILLPDASGTICLQSATACGFAASTGGSGYIQNQAATPQSANFNIQSAASGSIAALISGASGQSVDILDVKANAVTNPLFSVGSTGAATFRNSSDSPGAYNIQNANGLNVLNVDTTLGNVNLAIGNLQLAGVTLASAPTLVGSTSGGTLTASTAYQYLVAAVGPGGEGFDYPTNPSFYFTTNGTSSIALSWTAATGASTYYVYRSTDGINWKVLNVGNVTSYNDTSNTPWTVTGTRHDYSATGNIYLPQGGGIEFNPTASTFIQYAASINALELGNFQSGSGVNVYADNFKFVDSTGFNTNLAISNTGATIFKNRVDSTTAFQVQPSSSTTPVLDIDTTNSRVGIGTNAPAQALDVNGTARATLFRSNSGIVNDSSSNNARVTTGSTGTVIDRNIADANAALTVTQLNASSTGDILDLKNNSATVASVSQAGAVLLRNSTNSTTAFQVQNAAGTQLLNIDTSTTPNMITNGGFETNTTGWTARGSDAISRNTSNVFEGNASLQIVTTNTSLDGASYAVTLSPSTTYTLSMWTKGASAYTNLFNIGRQDVSGTDVLCSNFSVAASWSRTSCTFTTGSTITSSNIFISQNTAAIRTLYIDGVQLQTGGTATAYQNGLIQLNGIINSPTVFKNQSDSNGAFQIQNVAGTSIFNVDTNGSQVTISGGLTVTGAGNITANNNVNVGNALTLGSSLSAGAISKTYTAGGTNANFDVLVMNSSGNVVTTTTPHDPRIIGVAGSAATVGVAEGVTVYGNWTVNADTGAVAIGDQLVTSSTAGAVTVDNNATSGILGFATSAKAGGSTGIITARIIIANGQSTPKFQNISDSATAFQIQNVAGNNYLLVNTSGASVSLGDTGIASTVQIGNTTGSVTQTINIGNNTAGTTNIAIGNTTAGTTTLQSAGGTVLSTLGTTNNSAFLCRNTSNILAACNTTGTGAAFVQGGNSFGATATLGTNDSNSLTFETNNVTQATIAVGGATAFQNSTNSTAAFQVQNAIGDQLINVDTTNSNIVTNPSFEANTTGWVQKGTSTLTQITSDKYIGTGSMQVAASSTAFSGAEYVYTQTNGITYTATLWAKAISSNFATFDLGHSDTGASNSSCLTAQTVVTTGWTKFSCSWTASSPSSSGYFYVDHSDGVAHTFLIDGVQIYASNTSTIYKEGTISLNGVISSPTVFQNQTDSTTAFQIQNAAGTSNLFVVDTVNGLIGIGGAPIAGGFAPLQVTGGISATSTIHSNSTITAGSSLSSGTSVILNSSSLTTSYLSKGYTVNASTGVTVNDVVSFINDSGNYRIVSSNTARDPLVAGVAVATAAASAGAEVAISGNFTVNADTLSGANPIAIGDQLVTSTSTGRVIKDNNATTGILGYATSALGSGTGTVTVTIRPVGGQNTPKFQNNSDSSTAFQIQNAAGSDLVNVNNTDGYIINNGTEGLDNQIQNAGFESSGTTDSTGWFTPSATQVITNSSANAHTGNYELQVTGNSTTHAVVTKWYAVHPGDQIYVEAWVKNSAAAPGDDGIYLEFADKDKGSSSFTNNDTGVPGTSYVLKSITATVPAGKAYVRAAASTKATATSGTFYFDDFYMKRINQQAPLLISNVSTTAFQVQNASAVTVLGVDSTNSKIFSGIADGASAVGFTLNTSNSYSTAGAKLLSLQNNGSEKLSVSKDGDLTAAGNISIATGKTYQINGTQITSAALFNDTDIAKLSGTGPQVFSGNNKFTGTVLSQTTSATAFQVQNATNSILLVDASANKTVLGTAGASGLTAKMQFNFSGSTGSISLVPLDPTSTAYTINLPAENGTVCTSAASSPANCTNFASASSLTTGLSGKLNKGATDTSSAAVVSGNLYAFTNSSSNVASGVLKLDNGNNTEAALLVTGTTDYATGKAYIVVNNTNGTPTGNLIDLQSNGADEFTVDASGNVSAAGNISIATGKFYEINGTQISSAALSDGSSLAKLGATQTFTGANTFSNASNAFTGDGSGLTNLNATNIASGTLNDGRLSTNVALLNRGAQTFTGDNIFAPTSNNVGQVIRQTSGTATSGNVLDVQTANTTGHFLQITNAAANEGAVTLQSVGATRDLTLNSGSGTIKIPSSTTGIQNTGSTSFSIDVQNGSNSTLFITNSSTGLASLDVEGGINIASGQTYKINNTQITSAALSNDSDIAKLSGTGPQIFTGNNKFTGTVLLKSSSTAGFQIQPTATSTVLFGVDTAATTVSIGAPTIFNAGTYSSGSSSTITQSLIDNNTTVQAQATTSGLTFTMPTPTVTTLGRLAYITNTGANAFILNYGTGSFTLSVNSTVTLLWNGSNWTGAGADAGTLQNAYNNSTGGTTPEIKLDSTRSGIDIQDADTTLGSGVSLFTVRASNGGGLGNSLFNILANGKVGINIGSSSTTPTISNDLSFGQIAGVTTARTFGVEAQGTTNIGGNGLSVTAGTGNGTAAGGILLLQGGTSGAGAAAVGGIVNIFGGNANGSGASNGGNVVISGGTKAGSGTGGSVIVKPQASNDTTTAFQIQNAAGSSFFAADSTNKQIILGSGDGGSPSAMTVRGAAAAGSDVIGADLTFDASNGTGAGGSGAFVFRTAAGVNGTPVTKDVANSTSGALATSLTFSHTTAVQSNRLLIVGTDTTKAASYVAISSVTYNGVALTRLLSSSGPNSADRTTSELWYLVAPATGAHNVVVTPASATDISAGSITYYNVDQTSPFGVSATTSGTSTSPSVTLTGTTANQLVMDVMGDDGNAKSVNGSQTQQWNVSANLDSLGGSTLPGVLGNTTMSWTISGGAVNWADLAVAINPNGGSGSDTLSERLRIDQNGSATFQSANTTSAFQVKNATGTSLFGINSTNSQATVNAGTIFATNTYSSGSTSTITQATINNNTTVLAAATATSLTFTVPSPSITTAGRLLYLSNNGANAFTVNYGTGSFVLNVNSTVTLMWNGSAWTNGGADAGTLQTTYNNSTGGTTPEIKLDSTRGTLNIQDADSTIGADILDVSSSQSGAIGTILFGVGNTGNVIHRTTTNSTTAFQLQNNNGASMLTLDNTNTDGGTNLAQNSGCELGTTTCTNWAIYGSGTPTRDTGAGNFISGAAAGKAVTSATNSGLKNTLSATLSQSTTYLISFSIKGGTGASDLAAAILYNGTTIDTGTGAVNSCGTTMSITTSFARVTCTFTTGSSNTFTSSNALAVYETTTGRTFYLDNLSIIAQVSTNAATTAQLKVGGVSGQGLTLLTVDSFAGRPNTSATPNTALLGSMYYDTTLGKMQCYEAAGWGYCGAAPDVSVNLVPEYTGAVLDASLISGGNNIGTLTSGICSSSSRLSINTSVCNNTTDDYNYYSWNTIQPTTQSYSIYVRYQLPASFKSISTAGITVAGKSTDISAASGGSGITDGVRMTMYDASNTTCFSNQAITTSASTWVSTSLTSFGSCTFTANSIVMFKIDVTATNGGTAYVSNISFIAKGQ